MHLGEERGTKASGSWEKSREVQQKVQVSVDALGNPLRFTLTGARHTTSTKPVN